MKNKISLTFVVLASVIHSAAALAAVPADVAAKLGKNLTPIGAERSANADGSIPEWTGGLPENAGQVTNGFRQNPFPNEKPLFTVDAKNFEQYKGFLSDGQVAMLKRYPDSYKIPVYTTHRTAGLSDKLAADIKYNAVNARTIEEGNGLENFRTAIPFPIPANANEVMWNHITRYRGGIVQRQTSSIASQPAGQFVPINMKESFAYADQLSGYNPAEASNILFYYKQKVTAPARLAGDVYLIHETLNQVSEPRMAWAYNAGQRRVRRAPQAAYDAPAQSTEGLKTADGMEIFNGALDRYDWKLVGKREMFIPYNSYLAGAPDVNYKDLLLPLHMNPQYARYEKHRVWEVVGTLKPGVRHIYSKRHLFIDEDTWTIAAGDQYDANGNLWRVAEAHLQYFYDVKVTFQTPEIWYDLISNRYVATGLINQQTNAYAFGMQATKGEYLPAALRTEGVR